MPANGAPTLDLALVVGTTPPEIVTAIPLEPAARVLHVNPPFPAPDRERLRGIDAEEIELGSVTLGTEPGVVSGGTSDRPVGSFSLTARDAGERRASV